MGWVVNATPGRFIPEKENRYSLCMMLGGPQGSSGRVLKISPPPGFDPDDPYRLRYPGPSFHILAIHYYPITCGYVDIITDNTLSPAGNALV